MKVIAVALFIPVVSRLVQATKSPEQLDKSGWDKVYRISPTSCRAASTRQRFRPAAVVNISSGRHTQEQEALKRDAIRSYAGRDREFVSRLPERPRSLCSHLAAWTHHQLVEVKRRCQSDLTAAECLADIKLPLTHPLVTQRRSDPAGRSPYEVRKELVDATAQGRFASRTDTIQETSEFLTFIISDSSTIQLLAIEELIKYIRKKEARSRTPRERQSLLHSLRYYFLKALEEPPSVDATLLRILWSMTTKSCAKTARQHIDLSHQGLNVRVTMQEILIVFWSDLIHDATLSTEDDCSKNPESNCAVVKTYLAYKNLLVPRLQQAALDEDFVHNALESMVHVHSLEHEQVDAQAVKRIAERCSRAAALDVIYGVQASKVRFGKLIDYVGRHSWTRRLLMSLVRKSIRRMMHGHHPTTSMTNLKAAPARSSEHIVGASLFYGFTSGSKTWALTGYKGVGRVVAFVIRKEVLQMWTGTHPRAHSGVESRTADKSFIQQPVRHALFFPWKAAPRKLRAVLTLHGYLKHADVSMRRPLELALLQRKWTPTKRRLVFGGAGLALVLLAAGGLTAGSLVSVFFPLLFLFAGIAMCLYSVIFTLKSQGLIFVSSSAADEDSAEEEDG